MHRKTFLQQLGMITAAMPLAALGAMAKDNTNSPTMPVLFLGHGSPMNAIEDNEFVHGFRAIGKKLPTPQAILCVSAHWETRGTYVTAMEQPRTIHDFGGFPQALFDVQYPAPGSPTFAQLTQSTVPQVQLDSAWGLDHGCWSVVKHLYPKANIPVLQLSLSTTMNPEQHYQLAKQLQALRKKGVLIVGSGNMVHNLGMVAWDKLNAPNFGFDWAIEAQTSMKNAILQGNHALLYNYAKQGKSFQNAIPTPEHFLPLLYALALQQKNEKVQFFNEAYVAGALSMTSILIA